MDAGEEEEADGAQAEDGDVNTVIAPRMMNSLVISPSKSVTRSSQALSPIHKPSIKTNTGDFISQSESKDSCGRNVDNNVYTGNLNENQDLHIHSAAVVKSSEVEFPVQFHELQSNTDLKMPPSNWLQEHSSIRLPNPTHKHADFSSFLMAHQFPDCIGEVDVVSDAENIKKLLKIPYNPKAHVSMMIHRVGKTLLIDDFDVYKYLLRQSEKEWHWLRRFFFEHVLQSLTQKENVLVRPNKSRNVVQSRSLLSKFLYHSINEEEARPPSPPSQPVTESPVSVRRPSLAMNEVMPEPALEEQLPQASGQAFTRNVVWNFEDLHMLIGTDLPIFGGGTHPCVSLRLRDMSKPINILTGIDYWLDNLMCNVPEVVMCYHLDGIVQKYELIKTEDLPHMSDCQFSPRLVRDVAQNILSFLNCKATKEGHTYWLFKGKDDDIVKLYDLTSLCLEGRLNVDGTEEETQTEDSGNPFTIPVAMLFYRVAKNMRSSEDAHTKIASIRALLKNSLTLLDKNEYPKIVSSAHYMLSDLYVPQDLDPDSPVLSDCSDEDSEWSSTVGSDDEDCCDMHDSQSVAPANSSSTIKVSSLCKPHASKTQSHYYKAPPLLGTLEERCQCALNHVVEALQCLHLSSIREREHCGSKRSKESSMGPSRSQDQQEPKMARPFQPIPMPYSPLNTNTDDGKKALVLAKERPADDQLTVSVLCQQYCVASWLDKLNVLLLRKASLVYLVMARTNFNVQRLGLEESEVPVPCQALTLAGDIFYMISKAWEEVASHIDDYNFVTSPHDDMLTLLDNILPAQECSWTIKLPCDVEEALALGCVSFEKAVSAADPQAVMLLSRRLGNVCNELGVMYMNQAAKKDIGFQGAEELWQRSAEVLNRGIENFNRVKDVANVALLHSNTGRLLRLCAFYCVPKTGPRQFINPERYYYDQAVTEYQKALEALKSRKKSMEIWDLVVWEYGTTLYTMASLLQDHPPPLPTAGEDITREVLNILTKALKYCDVKTPGARQPLYQYRAAVIYMRLAGIYHNAVRDGEGDMKNIRHLAELNYGKAATLFMQLENPIDMLKVQLDQAVLIEDQLLALKISQASAKEKINQTNTNEIHQTGLCNKNQPIQMEDVTMDDRSRFQENNNSEEISCQGENLTFEDEENQEKIRALLVVFEKKLQNSLMTLIKINSSLRSKKSSHHGNDVSFLKEMYSLSLNKQSLPLAAHLLSATSAIAPLLNQIRPRR
ncbi:Erythroid differentiation-related factor 1-like [Homarus americanus]|uniref:Erythroid differentiation-related factor 1-like n=1 Tax=Homarus americanus TaxID=6706 RepID=A0A8J5KCN1_HOMAM|nr:Erythroid differentiation-related factor 1-like [Homarus americanus]